MADGREAQTLLMWFAKKRALTEHLQIGLCILYALHVHV